MSLRPTPGLVSRTGMWDGYPTLYAQMGPMARSVRELANTFLIFASSITVPAGFTSNNLTVGITFFGLPYSEPMLLKLAYSYEQATHHRVPPKTTPPL